MRYKVDVMTGSKGEAAGIGDGASKLKLTQQKQQNAGCQKSSGVPYWHYDQNKFNYVSQC